MNGFEAEVGDILKFERNFVDQNGGRTNDSFAHVAVFLGRNRVIHLWNSSGSNHCVRIDSISFILASYGENASPTIYNCTQSFDHRMRRRYRCMPLDGPEVVNRAKERLGETRYDVLEWNCEHFATWARYNKSSSLQVKSNVAEVMGTSLIGAAIGGVTGLLVFGGMALYSKYSSGMALASSAGVASSAAIPNMGEFDDDDDYGFVWVNDHECSICLNEYSRDSAICSFGCGHNVCQRCYDLMVVKTPYLKCPFCRQRVDNIRKGAATVSWN